MKCVQVNLVVQNLLSIQNTKLAFVYDLKQNEQQWNNNSAS